MLWVFLRECYLLLAYIVMMLLKKHKTLYICWKFGFKKVSPATHSKMIMRIVWGITASWLDVQQFCTTVIVSFRVINTSSLQSSTCNKFKIDSDWDIGRKCLSKLWARCQAIKEGQFSPHSYCTRPVQAMYLSMN